MVLDFKVQHHIASWVLTLKPSSPGFSGSKSYRATAAGVWSMGERAGLFMGEGSGEAARQMGREGERLG